MENRFYVYVYLDQRRPGIFPYRDVVLEYEPFYVGKGTRKRETRHLRESEMARPCDKNTRINEILSETGELPLHRRVFTGLTDNEAMNIEMDMIRHFGRRDLGSGTLLNLTDGGDGRKNMSAAERNARAQRFGKPVYQYRLDGTFVRKWRSAGEPARFGMAASRTSILTAIVTDGTADGFIWSRQYLGDKIDAKGLDGETRQINQRTSTYINVCQIDPSGNTIARFSSLNTAALTLSRSLSVGPTIVEHRIRDCVNGKRITAYGFVWKATRVGFRGRKGSFRAA